MMTSSTISHDRDIEFGRLSPGHGDFPTNEEALCAAIERGEAEAGVGSHVELTTALMSLGALKRERGRDAEAEELFRRALDVSEHALGPNDPALVPALTGLGAVRLARGTPGDAERALTRALAISEAHLGSDNPELVVLLNEITRLYLTHASYALAEPLLLRLYALKRDKGEEHPEVATVLASLATVRQALGRHDTAEGIWRRVLAIRERTLPPNHFSIATSLEHLADACFARGKLEEALQLLHRARSIREVTLGPKHPSVRESNERIADLQLQASGTRDDGVRSELRISAATIGRTNLPDYAGESPALIPEASTPHALIMGARVEGTEGPTPRVVEPIGAPDHAPTASTSYLESLIVLNRVLDEAHARKAREDASSVTMVGAARAALWTRRAPIAFAGVAMATLGLIAVGATSQPRAMATAAGFVKDWPRPESLSLTAPVRIADSVARPQLITSEAAGLAAAPAADIAITPPTPTTERIERRPESRAGDPRLRIAPIAIAALPASVGGGADSVVSSLTAQIGSYKESAAPAASNSGNELLSSSHLGTSRATRPARLIGALPQPAYPQTLRDARVGGEVVVQFVVDTTGRPDMRTLAVLRSPHELLSAAVRGVIPRLRFDPAQSDEQELAHRAERVEIAFRFSVNAR